MTSFNSTLLTILFLIFNSEMVFAKDQKPTSTKQTAAVTSKIFIEESYVRLPPPVAKNSAGFMIIKNTDSIEHQIKEVQSNISEVTELHTHIAENGMMKMRKVDSLTIPANGQIELKPGSHHVMFIGLIKPLEEGQIVPIKFVFDDNSVQNLEVKVIKK